MGISDSIPVNFSLPTSSSILNTDTVIAITVFITLLCLCIVIGHLVEENRWANESITALLLVCTVVFLFGFSLYEMGLDQFGIIGFFFFFFNFGLDFGLGFGCWVSGVVDQ